MTKTFGPWEKYLAAQSPILHYCNPYFEVWKH